MNTYVKIASCKECKLCKEQRIVNKALLCKECAIKEGKEKYQLYSSKYYKKKQEEKHKEAVNKRQNEYLSNF